MSTLVVVVGQARRHRRRTRRGAAGFDADDARVRQVLAMAQRHPGVSAASVDPRRRVRALRRAARERRPGRACDDARSHRDPLGQGRPRHAGLLQGRRPRSRACSPRSARLSSSSQSTRERRVVIERIDRLARSPPRIPLVYDALCAADTVGVFQIESRAQMAMLPRLQPAKLLRPGRRGRDRASRADSGRDGAPISAAPHRAGGRDAPHPMLAPILERTLGVPLFQEQVMQIAIVGAGYTGGEADQLRRDMAAWQRNGKLERHRDAPARGLRAQRDFRASSASSSTSDPGLWRIWLSREPRSELCAPRVCELVAQGASPGGVRRGAHQQPADGLLLARTIVKDARGTASKSCQRASTRATGTARSKASMDRTAIRRLAARPPSRRQLRRRRRASASNAPDARSAFAGIEDLVDRAALDRRELDALARAGALAGFGLGRREALWKARAPREDDLLAGVDFHEEAPKLAPCRTPSSWCSTIRHGRGRGGSRHERRTRGTFRRTSRARAISLRWHGERVSTAGWSSVVSGRRRRAASCSSRSETRPGS